MNTFRSLLAPGLLVAILGSCGGSSAPPPPSGRPQAPPGPATAALPAAPAIAEPRPAARPPVPVAPAPEGVSGAPLVFGLYPSDNPTEMHRQFAPLVEYLARVTRRRIELQVSPGYEEGRQWIRAGKADFFRSGAAFYGTLLTQPGGKGFALVAQELWEGEKLFQGAVVVREGSPIRTLADLRGRSFAFGDKSSTMGTLLPRRILEQNGVPLSALARYEHLRSHDDVALAVANAAFDAGACKKPTAEKYRTRGLRILDVELVSPSKPIFARAGLDPAVVESVRAALLALDSKDPDQARIMQGIEKKLTGFAAGDPADFERFARLVGEEDP